MSSTIQDYVAERNQALLDLDIEFVRKHLSQYQYRTDEFMLLILHKMRYEVATMPPDKRIESRKWLQNNGYKRIDNLPWPENDQL